MKYITIILSLVCGIAYGQTPTPTPGTPDDWLAYIEEQPDCETFITENYDPVETVGGTHKRSRYAVTQSVSAGVAVQRERGYVEIHDVEGLRGLQNNGYVSVEMSEPVLESAFGDKEKVNPEKEIIGVEKVKGDGPQPEGDGWVKKEPKEWKTNTKKLDAIVEKPVSPKKTKWNNSYEMITEPTWIRYKYKTK